ncbi:ornithine cyclodeaminase family protein [Acidaminobacter sp. JC074]|uniref:ornithine cyclodeaminase family protein n=1 Tax=Acidaminobacter sp. JC074 TaxID=2530199 RepID=UPI001F0EEC75|nr:hypothetical protein [Acidaminobacter sp. JC074]MCH4886982.1 ornithine cyclodeaminase family protein [Acidaminobacter sp. JC074]
MSLMLGKSDVEHLLTMKDALESVEEAYKIYGKRALVQPPIVSIDAEIGELDIKSCYSKETDLISIKSASGFWRNKDLGLPSLLATVTLLDSKTGSPLCMMDGSLITGYRTGAAGGLSCKYLARKDSKLVGIIGAGNQARMQLMAIKEVLDIEQVKIWALSLDSMILFKKEMEILGVEVTICETAKEACDVDILVTTTPSKEPIVKSDWVKPGTHIVAVGADAEGKQELDPDLYLKARAFCDSISQVTALGETRNAIEAGTLNVSDLKELSDLVLEDKYGRTTREEITLFDTTGMGIQDTCLATLLYNKAKSLKLGKDFDFLS